MVSVVVPFYNSRDTIDECLSAITAQKGVELEIIAVDDGSTDDGAAVAARPQVRVIRQDNKGAAAARNTGARAAIGEWIAFTDADCIPSRRWLHSLFAAATENRQGDEVIGAAGPIASYPSTSPAARFVDISGAFDVERHLSHPLFPFAPSGNVMYRRDLFMAVGGYDERMKSYESCDLHMRLRRHADGQMRFASPALVLHRHRESWPEYWKQQKNYGRGLGQFYMRWANEVPWSVSREAKEWIAIAGAGLAVWTGGGSDARLLKRGELIKRLAQRLGFVSTYFSSTERARWSHST
jgi:glycosyltransferase involved in cell wall biosynthesis